MFNSINQKMKKQLKVAVSLLLLGTCSAFAEEAQEDSRNITDMVTWTVTITSQNSVKESGSGLELCNATNHEHTSSVNIQEESGIILSTYTDGSAGEYKDIYQVREDRPNGQYLGIIKATVHDDFGNIQKFRGNFNSQRIGSEFFGTTEYTNGTSGCKHTAKISGKLNSPLQAIELKDENGKSVSGEVLIWLKTKVKEKFDNLDSEDAIQELRKYDMSVGVRG